MSACPFPTESSSTRVPVTAGPSASSRCTVCGSTALQPFLSELRDRNYANPVVVAMRRCQSCRTVQQDPLPSAEEAIGFYPTSYVHYNPTPGGMTDRLITWQMQGTLRLLRRLGASPGRRLLDVGSGGGRGLSAIRDGLGLDVVGIEPSASAAAKARQAYGLNVLAGTFPNDAIGPETVDFVRINHVIEHVPDPIRLLDAVWTALKPGGWVIGETENLDCPSHRLFGRHWSLLHPPYHLLLFNGTALNEVFSRSAFREVTVRFLPDPTAWSLSFQTYLRRNLIPDERTPARMAGYLPLTLACLPLALVEVAIGRGPLLQFWSARPH
jgi:2-polyprenyl-3-methyl-5-hydroxy-6-metoxy-1,4-benzoquinol methylase